MQITHVLQELSQNDTTPQTVTGTKRQQTNHQKEESTYKQRGRVWDPAVTYARKLPYCPVTPWLPLAGPRHEDWKNSRMARASSRVIVRHCVLSYPPRLQLGASACFNGRNMVFRGQRCSRSLCSDQ